MKALVLEEYGKLKIKEVEKPEAQGNRVLIKSKQYPYAEAMCTDTTEAPEDGSRRL